MTLIEYLQSLGATTASYVEGPNGHFISYEVDGERRTLPVGRRSYGAPLKDYNILEAEDGGRIATVNNYKTGETISL